MVRWYCPIIARCIQTNQREKGGLKMKYSVIAIEREYASGGREIGERLAGKLGVPCYGEIHAGAAGY